MTNARGGGGMYHGFLHAARELVTGKDWIEPRKTRVKSVWYFFIIRYGLECSNNQMVTVEEICHKYMHILPK